MEHSNSCMLCHLGVSNGLMQAWQLQGWAVVTDIGAAGTLAYQFSHLAQPGHCVSQSIGTTWATGVLSTP